MAIVLTHNAKYKPMSFDEMIRPYVMATEEYRTLEKGIADLDAEAESMRQIAQAEIDEANKEGRAPKAFATNYMNYANSLDAKAVELANKGLKGVNRKSLYDLQAQYKTNVKPIEDADKYIKEIAKEQRLLNKSGNLVFDRDFSNGVSIQDVIDNPSLGYNVYDLNDYGKQAVLEGTAIKAGMTPVNLGTDDSGQNLLYSQGMSDEDLYNWLAGTSNEELDATVNRIAGNAPQAVKDRVKSDLAKSLRATISTKDNKAYDYAQRKDLALYQHNLSEQSKINAEIREANRKARTEQDKKQDQDIAYRNAVFGIGNIVGRGGEGVYSESTNRMEGLVGNTTARLDNLKTVKKNAQDAYTNYIKENNISEEEFLKDSNELQHLKTLLDGVTSGKDKITNQITIANQYQTAKAEFYRKYNSFLNLKADLDEANKMLSEEEAFIQEFENKYWYLGGTQAERLQRGLALQRHLEAQQTEDIFLNLEPTSYDKITEGIATQLGAYSEESIKSKKAGLVDSKGNHLSKKEMKSILENPKDLGLKVIKEKGKSKLVFTKDNEEYEIKDAGGLESWMKEVSKVQAFLSDFSPESYKDKSNVIAYQSNEGFASLGFKKALSEGNIKDFIVTEDSSGSNTFNTYFSTNKIKGEKLGNDLYGYTIVDASSKDMYKVITDSEGNVKSINMASDEINNGIRRNTSIDELIKLGLYNLKDTYAKKQD